MISDPDDPAFRAPLPGERYWHRPWACWVTVGSEPTSFVDEVSAVRERDGQPVTVKLRSLVPRDEEPGPLEQELDELLARPGAPRWYLEDMRPLVRQNDRAEAAGIGAWLAPPREWDGVYTFNRGPGRR